MSDDRRILAKLFYYGIVSEKDETLLRRRDVRDRLNQRLTDIGFQLSEGVYTRNVGLLLHPELASSEDFAGSSNKQLTRDEMLLVVLLWAKLRLPEMRQANSDRLTGQNTLNPVENARRIQAREFGIKDTEIKSEFKHLLGAATAVDALLTRLVNLGFIRREGGLLFAAPQLELAFDNQHMRNEILSMTKLHDETQRAQALATLPFEDTGLFKVRTFFEQRSEKASKSECQAATNLSASAVDRAVTELVELGQLARVGPPNDRTYRIREALK